jgi:hypothetical protein
VQRDIEISYETEMTKRIHSATPWIFNREWWISYNPHSRRKKKKIDLSYVPPLEDVVISVFSSLNPPISHQRPEQWSMIGKTYAGLAEDRSRLRSFLLLTFPPLLLSAKSASFLNSYFWPDSSLQHTITENQLWPQYYETMASNPLPQEWIQSSSAKNYENWCAFLVSKKFPAPPLEDYNVLGPIWPNKRSRLRAGCWVCPLHFAFKKRKKLVEQKVLFFEPNSQIYDHTFSKKHLTACFWISGQLFDWASLTSTLITPTKNLSDDGHGATPCPGISDSSLLDMFKDEQGNVVKLSSVKKKWESTSRSDRCPAECNNPCQTFLQWKISHPQLYEGYRREVANSPEGIFVRTMKPRILSAKCTTKLPNKPYCDECANLREYLHLKALRRMDSNTPRVCGQVGVRCDFVSQTERTRYETELRQEDVNLRKTNEKMSQVISALSTNSSSWEGQLERLCGEQHFNKVLELVKFMQLRKYVEYPIQFQILSNLLSRMLGKRSDCSETIHKVSFILKRSLGHSMYIPFKEMLKFPSESTLRKKTGETHPSPGFQTATLQNLIERFEEELLMITTDDQRLARTFRAILSLIGVEIHGHAFSGDWQKWEEERILLQKWVDEARLEGTSAIKFIHEKIAGLLDTLATHAQLHTLTCITQDLAGVIAAIHPLPFAGFTTNHLLSIWIRLRELIFMDVDGNLKRRYPNVIGFSADHVPIFLNALLELMNPKYATTLLFGLALGHYMERFIAWYIGPLPALTLGFFFHICIYHLILWSFAISNTDSKF